MGARHEMGRGRDSGEGETWGRQGQEGHGPCRGEGPHHKRLLENVPATAASSPFSARLRGGE